MHCQLRPPQRGRFFMSIYRQTPAPFSDDSTDHGRSRAIHAAVFVPRARGRICVLQQGVRDEEKLVTALSSSSEAQAEAPSSTFDPSAGGYHVRSLDAVVCRLELIGCRRTSVFLRASWSGHLTSAPGRRPTARPVRRAEEQAPECRRDVQAPGQSQRRPRS